MWSSPEPLNTGADPENRSIILPDGSRGATMGGSPESPLYTTQGLDTLYDAFRRGHQISKNGKCLGERTGPNKEYVWMTYDQVLTRAEKFASGLIHLGLKPTSYLGIYSLNNSKWLMTEQACNTQSIVTIAFYDSLGVEACQYIINLAELTVIVCDTLKRFNNLVKDLANLPTLKTIITMCELNDETRKEATDNNISVYTFEEVETLGVNNPHEARPPKPSDLATICFTSGTTGVPKGAMLSHENIVSNASCLAQPYYFGRGFLPEECHLSYLPLAHMYERTVQVMMFMHGCHIGFFRGDPKLLLEDLQELKPTLFTAVPRILNKIYDKVRAGVQGSRIKSFLLDMAIQQKSKEIERRIIRKDSIWDKLILSKIQALLGGNVQMITTGSAPLSGEVLRFTRAALGCLVVEGYGQTEANAGVTFQYAGDNETGHVGGPVACNIVKLMDVEDMGYVASENKGEICVKGTNVFLGYFKDPERTAEALDKDGWLHTGDIGTWLPNGGLKIIDRKKHIYKLSQGEYIAPEKIETVYMRSKFVAQAFVDGDSVMSCSMAVIVPDVDVLLPWAKEKNLPQDMDLLCRDKEIKTVILEDILQNGRSARLTSLEQVKDIHLCPKIFTLEDGLMTPTFKNKRPAIRLWFAEEFKQMYASINS